MACCACCAAVGRSASCPVVSCRVRLGQASVSLPACLSCPTPLRTLANGDMTDRQPIGGRQSVLQGGAPGLEGYNASTCCGDYCPTYQRHSSEPSSPCTTMTYIRFHPFARRDRWVMVRMDALHGSAAQWHQTLDYLSSFTGYTTRHVEQPSTGLTCMHTCMLPCRRKKKKERLGF